MRSPRIALGLAALLLLAACAPAPLVRMDCATTPIAERARCEQDNESQKALTAEQLKAQRAAERPGEFDKKDLEATRDQ